MLPVLAGDDTDPLDLVDVVLDEAEMGAGGGEIGPAVEVGQVQEDADFAVLADAPVDFLDLEIFAKRWMLGIP